MYKIYLSNFLKDWQELFYRSNNLKKMELLYPNAASRDYRYCTYTLLDHTHVQTHVKSISLIRAAIISTVLKKRKEKKRKRGEKEKGKDENGPDDQMNLQRYIAPIVRTVEN